MLSLDNMGSNRSRAIKLDISNHPLQHGPLHQLNSRPLNNTGNITKKPPALNLSTKPTTPNPTTKPKPPAWQRTTKPNSPKPATTPTPSSPV